MAHQSKRKFFTNGQFQFPKIICVYSMSLKRRTKNKRSSVQRKRGLRLVMMAGFKKFKNLGLNRQCEMSGDRRKICDHEKWWLSPIPAPIPEFLIYFRDVGECAERKEIRNTQFRRCAVGAHTRIQQKCQSPHYRTHHYRRDLVSRHWHSCDRCGRPRRYPAVQ